MQYWLSDLEFSKLESWSRDVSRPVFTSLGLGLGLRTSEFWSWSWSWNPRAGLGLGLGLGTCDHEDSVFVTHEA